MNRKTEKKLAELGAHPKLVRAFEELPAVIGGHSFLGSNRKLELRNVEVAIYWNKGKEKVAGAYIYGEINATPIAVNVFLAENFSVHLGPRGGVREVILRTFGGHHSFGTTTRRRASMWDYYHLKARNRNSVAAVGEDTVTVKVSEF